MPTGLILFASRFSSFDGSHGFTDCSRCWLLFLLIWMHLLHHKSCLIQFFRWWSWLRKGLECSRINFRCCILAFNVRGIKQNLCFVISPKCHNNKPIVGSHWWMVVDIKCLDREVDDMLIGSQRGSATGIVQKESRCDVRPGPPGTWVQQCVMPKYCIVTSVISPPHPRQNRSNSIKLLEVARSNPKRATAENNGYFE